MSEHTPINAQCRDTRCQDTQRTATDVANQFEEALLTLKRLPPVRVQGYFKIWPDIIHSPQELSMLEVQPMRVTATPAAITRLEQTLSWMYWLTIEERKLLWWRAARIRWKVICLACGCDRSTAWRKWMSALDKIAGQLNNPQQVAQKRG